MKTILFSALFLLGLPGIAGAQENTPPQDTSSAVEVMAGAVGEQAPIVVAPAPKPVYGTCESALAATQATYDQELAGVMQRHADYFLFDEHTVNCDGKRVRFLVLFSRNGNLPAQVVAVDVSRFEENLLR